MNKNQHRQTGNQNHYHHACFCQALVLTPEGATDFEKFPYLAVMLQPLRVLEFYGRSTSRDPVCPKFEAVFHWWQDAPKFCNFAKKINTIRQRTKIYTIRLRTKLNTIRQRSTFSGLHFS